MSGCVGIWYLVWGKCMDLNGIYLFSYSLKNVSAKQAWGLAPEAGIFGDIMGCTFPFETRLRYLPLTPNFFILGGKWGIPASGTQEILCNIILKHHPIEISSSQTKVARRRLRHLKCYKQYFRVLIPLLIFSFYLLMHYLLKTHGISSDQIHTKPSKFKVDLLKTV